MGASASTASRRAARPAPDPLRAHGAWVYLFVSVGAGALLGAGRGVEPALLVGTGFAGGFLCAAALVVGARRRRRQLLVGCATAFLAPLAALALGAEPAFLVLTAGAALPAVGAVLLASRFGFLSRAAVVTGIAALVLAAPAAAVSGGASASRAAVLFLLLWPFYCWRSMRLAEPLEAGARWDRDELRARGLREAGIAALWTLAVAVGLRLA